MDVANLVSDQNVFFLEASNMIEYVDNMTHLPQKLSALKSKYIIRHMYKRVQVDSFVRCLYKKDVYAYYSNVSDSRRSIRSERKLIRLPVSIGLYCWDLWRRHYLSNQIKFSPGVCFFKTLVGFATFFRVGKALSFHKTKRIRSFLLRFGFIAGYNYYHSVFAKIKPTNGDVFLNWGLHYSGSVLLEAMLSDTGAKTRILEYGEVSGTVSISRSGIFGDSDVAQNWQWFTQQKVGATGLDIARTALSEIDNRDAASRGGEDSMFRIYRNMFDINPQRRRVVYVNGCELIASGHFENPDLYNNKFRNPNENLLNSVCKSFAEEGAMILYKDHPMTLRSSTNLEIDQAKFPSVVFIRDLNMKSILEISDVVVSFPSKVVMTALAKSVKTIVVGKFTIPHEDLRMGLYNESALSDVSRLTHNCEDGDQLILQFVARMLDLNLVKYDLDIFPSLDTMTERAKLINLISQS